MEGAEWIKGKYNHSGHTLRHPFNVDLNINNENQNSNIGIVCRCGGGSRRGEGEGRRLRLQCMVDGLHIPIWNTTKKPLVIALCGVGKGLRGRKEEGIVNNIQCKCNWNCCYEFPHIMNIP
jgi:hypothetical protein